MKQTNNIYNDYFKEHYGYNFSVHDVENYKQWFYSQWRFILNKISLNENISILEIGSGNGGFYSFISQKNIHNYTGIELDDKAVEFSNSFFKTNNFKNISIEKFSSKKKFDIIFAFEVLEHLENPTGAISKIFGLLKENGVFCGTSPYPYPKNIFADQTHICVLHPSNWKKLFKDNNFNECSTYPMSFFPLLWRISKYINIKIPFYVPLDGFISTSLIIAKK